ncbi:hypothetical protein, partial [Pseudomonas mosselii]|uniref:hypothetical protein n=1 Tax=Pseudomonas mosselii TaxID=78327 RepID=UPI001BD6591F
PLPLRMNDIIYIPNHSECRHAATECLTGGKGAARGQTACHSATEAAFSATSVFPPARSYLKDVVL